MLFSRSILVWATLDYSRTSFNLLWRDVWEICTPLTPKQSTKWGHFEKGEDVPWQWLRRMNYNVDLDMPSEKNAITTNHVWSLHLYSCTIRKTSHICKVVRCTCFSLRIDLETDGICSRSRSESRHLHDLHVAKGFKEESDFAPVSTQCLEEVMTLKRPQKSVRRSFWQNLLPKMFICGDFPPDQHFSSVWNEALGSGKMRLRHK